MIFIYSFIILAILIALYVYMDTFDFTHPVVFISILYFFNYAFPAYLGHASDYSNYLPSLDFTDKAAMMPGFIVFISYLVFVIFYFGTAFLTKNSSQNIKFEFVIHRKKTMLAMMLAGMIGCLGIISLWRHTVYGDGAYYNMAGMGWANHLMSVFAIVPCFLCLRSEEKSLRYGAYILLTLIFISYGFILDRKTSTTQFILITLIALGNPFNMTKLKKKLSLFAVTSGVALPVGLLVFKYWGSIRLKLNSIFLFDVGRFDILMSALYYQDVDRWLSPMSYVKHIPYAVYMPIVKDVHAKMENLDQYWILGEKSIDIGGIGFTPIGEEYLTWGMTGIIFYSIFWGISWGWIYETVKRHCVNAKGLTSSSVMIGLFALHWHSNLSMGVPNPFWWVWAAIIILITGKIVFVKENSIIEKV